MGMLSSEVRDVVRTHIPIITQQSAHYAEARSTSGNEILPHHTFVALHLPERPHHVLQQQRWRMFCTSAKHAVGACLMRVGAHHLNDSCR